MVHTILLVEDEKWVRTAIRRTIERTELPFKVVHECENGLDGLDWLKEHSVDLVFTDVRMPVMDGINFVEQLRQLKKQQGIIFISGYEDFNFVQSALRFGAIDYLLKPVEIEEMKECLTKWSKNLLSAPEPTIVPSPLEISTIDKVIQYVKDSMPGEVTLYSAAEAVHLNPSYLSQLFKQKVNMNFSDYVLEQRLKEATKLLGHTSLTITEIGERLGYVDVAHFSKTFKKITGRTPSAYRKSLIQL